MKLRNKIHVLIEELRVKKAGARQTCVPRELGIRVFDHALSG